ncbi:MAG: hypothetical protein LBI02_04910 [Opitutaceae bacterium]|nr:hypothetical protein [Opitutaceae bacterium]
MRQAANALGVSRRHLERLIAKGVFPRPLRVGAAVRFTWGDVEGFVKRLNDERERRGAA